MEWYHDILPEIVRIAKEVDLPIVGTWDSHYLCNDDAPAHETLLKINTGGSGMKMDGNWSFINQKMACEFLKNILKRSRIQKRLRILLILRLILQSWFFPSFPIPEKQPMMQYCEK
jgi:DNA polymerase III alpha subunit